MEHGCSIHTHYMQQLYNRRSLVRWFALPSLPNLTPRQVHYASPHTHTHTRALSPHRTPTPLFHPSSPRYVLVGEGDAEGVDPPLPRALVGPDDRRIPDEHVFVRRRGRAASLVGCGCMCERWVLRQRGVCGVVAPRLVSFLGRRKTKTKTEEGARTVSHGVGVGEYGLSKVGNAVTEGGVGVRRIQSPAPDGVCSLRLGRGRAVPPQPRHHASDDAIQRPDNTRTRLTPPAYFSYLWRIVLQLFQIAHQAKHRRRRGSALFLRSTPAPAAAPGTAHRRVGRLALRHFRARIANSFPKSIW